MRKLLPILGAVALVALFTTQVFAKEMNVRGRLQKTVYKDVDEALKDLTAELPLMQLIKRRMEDKTPEKRVVYIRADIDVDYGKMVQAVDTIRKQDIDKVGLVADKKKGTEPRK